VTDRPAHTEDEIEVTPEMIEAGEIEFVRFDSRFEGPDEVVLRIYKVMRKARALSVSAASLDHLPQG
jgi:hypothetical protein